MPATLIPHPAPGEELLALSPELLQQSVTGWRRSLNFFTGRTLSSTALANQQTYRSSLFTLLGQSVTPGTVNGLEASIELTTADPILSVQPGYGILPTGEDVALLTALHTPLSTLPVLDQFGAVANPFATVKPAATAGILLLQPVTVQVNGSLVDTSPENILVSGTLEASCDQDPAEYAFQDLETLDAVRLVFCPWPSQNFPPLPALAANPVTFRNRLAWALFNAKSTLGPDDLFPFATLGLPVGLLTLDAASKPLFLDRFSVVRQGGLPRGATTFPVAPNLPTPLHPVTPTLAQARIAQFAEQTAQALALNPDPLQLAPSFTLLPPAGLLPASVLQFEHKQTPLPAGWTITAAPIHLEELESALALAATAEPLDPTRAEQVELLVPLPDSLYDPAILVTATVDPAFQQAIDAATAARNITLQHRKDVQQAQVALLTAAGQPPASAQALFDAGLTADELAARDATPAVYTPVPADAYGTQPANINRVANDIIAIEQAAAAAPYTVNIAGAPNNGNISLFSGDDISDLALNGIQHFVDRINAKLNRADDLINLAFVTSQTDIYRYRQQVLGSVDASRLATSTILANIATGDSSNATSQSIASYLANLPTTAIAQPAAVTPSAASPAASTSTPPASTPVTRVGLRNVYTAQAISPATVSRFDTLTASEAAAAGRPAIAGASLAATHATTITPASVAALRAISIDGGTTIRPIDPILHRFPVTTVNPPASTVASPTSTATVNVQSQQPIAGAQLDLRTLSVAERLKASPSQEALFYSVGNRLTFMQLLLALDLTVDDLQFLVDAPAATVTPGTVPPKSIPSQTFHIFELRADTTATKVYPQLMSPHLDDNVDEAGLFSSGIRVLDQHTQLLRAIEGRIQLYRDFLSRICAPALTSVLANLAAAQTTLAGLQNDLDQQRQDLAFTLALLADEQARIAALNTQRQATLASAVQVVAFTRPRSLDPTADVPSRQLVPGNLTSPVPACLGAAQAAMPQELQQMLALLREAPLTWFTSGLNLIHRITLPDHLLQLASAVQLRASVATQLPAESAVAASSSGVYARPLAQLFTTHQSAIRSYQSTRATLNPTAFAALSWKDQVATLHPYTAIGDLLVTHIVPFPVAHASSTLLQHIGNVAGCLYTRVGATLPAQRLAWAEFLTGAGASTQLRSLAVLPGFNTLPYVERQQMQLLVDWLFQQFDTTVRAALDFLSDLIRAAILLASHAPVNRVLAGAVAAATVPTVGGRVILSPAQLSSIAHGMSVQLFQAGKLAAEATVSDLDATSVTATITRVHTPNVQLDTTAVAHFTAQPTRFAVYRAFA